MAWSLAAPPGPINALIAHAAARRGFWAGWVYGLGAIAGDMTMMVLTGLGILAIVQRFPWLTVAGAALGAVLMAWFAWGAWRTARRVGSTLGSPVAPAGATSRKTAFADRDDLPLSKPREFAKAYVIVTTSPFNWAWWLTAGSSMMSLLGWATAIGFFAGLLVWTLLWAGLATAGGARVKRLAEFVAYGAAIVLALFATLMAWLAMTSAAALL